jgi:hypothetical protein
MFRFSRTEWLALAATGVLAALIALIAHLGLIDGDAGSGVPAELPTAVAPPAPTDATLREIMSWASPPKAQKTDDDKETDKAPPKKVVPVGPKGPQEGRLKELWVDQFRYRLSAVYLGAPEHSFAVLTKTDVPANTTDTISVRLNDRIGAYTVQGLDQARISMTSSSGVDLELELFEFYAK